MSSTAEAPPDEALDQPSVGERLALIERVAASAQFGRSTRLRDFLLYVGRQSVKDGCPEIHEQEIGFKVFGRPASYDRSQDNIVRVNATELRKRIDLYFATEGAHEPLIIEIPRGGYKPIFHRRLPALQGEPRPAPEAPQRDIVAPLETPTAPHNRTMDVVHIVWAVATLGLVLGCAFLVQQEHAMRNTFVTWDSKPAVAAFWGGFLGAHRQTDLVLPDDSVSLIEDLTHGPVSLTDYLNHNYMRQIQSASDLSPDRKVDLDNISSHNLVTFGGVRAAQLILSLVPESSSTNLTLARYYEADSIKRNNVILIGGKKANPWVHLFEQQANFITDYDYDSAHFNAIVRNVHPKPGEQAIYVAPHDPNDFFGYAVVAYMPNPSRTGNVIILAGTDSDATTAAAEFLTSEDNLNKFRSTLRVQNFPYFEVLLKTSRLSGTSFSSELLAYRTYPELR